MVTCYSCFLSSVIAHMPLNSFYSLLIALSRERTAHKEGCCENLNTLYHSPGAGGSKSPKPSSYNLGQTEKWRFSWNTFFQFQLVSIRLMFIKAHSGHFRLAFVHVEEIYLIQTLVAETVLGKCLYTFLSDVSRSTSLIHILVLVTFMWCRQMLHSCSEVI